MSTKLPHHCTIREAAEYLERDESQISRYIRDGKLKAIDLHCQRVIKKADLYAFTPDPPGNPAFQPAGE